MIDHVSLLHKLNVIFVRTCFHEANKVMYDKTRMSRDVGIWSDM